MAARSIFKTTKVENSFNCLSDCLSHQTCQSFNFQETGNPNHICELSESAVLSSPTCQESRPGYSYFFPFQVLFDFKTRQCTSSPERNFAYKYFYCLNAVVNHLVKMLRFDCDSISRAFASKRDDR